MSNIRTKRIGFICPIPPMSGQQPIQCFNLLEATFEILRTQNAQLQLFHIDLCIAWGP